MNSVKMYSIVGPMLTPGARQMLAGDVVMADTLLGSSNDVGVMLKCIEGLAGVCAKTGMSLGGVVQKAQEFGRASLGAAIDDAKTAWMNSNYVLGQINKGATSGMTQEDGAKLLAQMNGYAQQACQAAGTAGSQANSSGDQTDIDNAVAAQGYCGTSRANLAVGEAVVNKMPKAASNGVPTAKTCPPGQHLDASNNCVADTPSVTVNTGSSSWPIIGGILAGLGALYLWAESQKKKHPKRHAEAA